MAYKLWLVCDDKNILLAVFGIMMNANLEPPAYFNASARLSETAKVISYSGLTDDGYEFVRDDLR